MEWDVEALQKKWHEDAEKLEKDYDALRAYFNKHKKCRCHPYECKHFDKALKSVLGERTDDLMNRSLIIGLITHGVRIE